MSSLITSLTIVFSSVYSGADQSKHQSSASLAFVRRNEQVTREIPEQRASIQIHFIRPSPPEVGPGLRHRWGHCPDTVHQTQSPWSRPRPETQIKPLSRYSPSDPITLKSAQVLDTDEAIVQIHFSLRHRWGHCPDTVQPETQMRPLSRYSSSDPIPPEVGPDLRHRTDHYPDTVHQTQSPWRRPRPETQMGPLSRYSSTNPIPLK